MKQKQENGGAQNNRFIFHSASGAGTGRNSRVGMDNVVLPADRRCHDRDHHHYYRHDPLNQRHKEVKDGIQSEV